MYSVIGYEKDNDIHVLLADGYEFREAAIAEAKRMLPSLQKDELRSVNEEPIDWIEVYRDYGGENESLIWVSNKDGDADESVPPQLFHVGDTAYVVSTPYLDCPYGWVDGMNRYCGREVKIDGAIYAKARKMWAYTIRGAQWNWCENCFERPAPDIEESDEDISTLFE